MPHHRLHLPTLIIFSFTTPLWLALKIIFPEEGIAAFFAKTCFGLSLLSASFLLWQASRQKIIDDARIPAILLAAYTIYWQILPVCADVLLGAQRTTSHNFCFITRSRRFVIYLFLKEQNVSLRVDYDTFLILRHAATIDVDYWRYSGIIREFTVLQKTDEITTDLTCSTENAQFLD